MQFIKTVLTRISIGTPAFGGSVPGVHVPSQTASPCRIGQSLSLAAKRTGLGALGHKGREVCRFGRQNTLYGLHCDRDTARLVSVFAKGAMRPTARTHGNSLN